MEINYSDQVMIELLDKIISAYKLITGTDENFQDWANEPNSALDNNTPAELFDRGSGQLILSKLEEFINNGGD